jgi:outer membrane protein OmpA-like peptidoglycan-associated protein
MDAKMTNVRLGFAPGDATLPGPALATLKMLAHQRGVRSMVVTGFGDVVSSDAAAQAAGLTLALSRARAVAAYLMAVGVPPAAVRITGQAQGQGAAVRLTN